MIQGIDWLGKFQAKKVVIDNIINEERLLRYIFECYKEKKWPRRPEGISIEFTSFDKSKVIIE